MRNYKKWWRALKQPEYTDPVSQYNGEVQKLHDWLIKHVNWLDTAFSQAATSQAQENSGPRASVNG